MPASGPKGALFPTTYRAGAAVVAYRFVKRGADADSVIHNTAATILPLAITEEAQPTAAKPVRVGHRPGELMLIEAGAAFSLDAELTSDATGRAVAAVSTNPYGAIARQAAVNAGDLVLCEIRFGVKA